MSLQRIATIVSSLTAFLLVVMKLSVGLLSWSIAVLSSAIDSLLDLFVSLFNFFAVKNAEKPRDARFNYGRGKIEALASLFEGIIITLSWLYILYESIMKLMNGSDVSYLGTSIIVMIASFAITLWLVLFLDYAAKKTKNIVIQSDLLHYKTDLYSTWGVLFSLWVIYFTWFQSIDAIVWIIIAIYIIYSAFDLIKKWYILILDVSLDEDFVNSIKEIIETDPIVNNYHFLRTRQSGNTKFVDIHIVFHPEILLIDAHRASDHIEQKIRKLDTSSDWVFNIHLDPYDDSAVGG